MKKRIGFLVATTLAVGVFVIGVSAFGGKGSEMEEKAFAEAGVNATEVRDVESELDYENGKAVYEVEFESDGYEYDYNIDAQTGEVLNSEKDRDDDANKKQQTTKVEVKPEVRAEVKPEPKADTVKTDDIGEEKTKAIALKNAGVSEDQITRLRVERDYDDGRLEYSVEFHVGNKEYDYEIDAKTGKILESDIDVDDDFYS